MKWLCGFLLGGCRTSSTIIHSRQLYNRLQAEVPEFRAKTLFKASMCYKTFHGLPVEAYPASETPSAESSSGQADSAVPGEVALIGSHGCREFTYNWRSPKADVMVSMWKAQDGRMNGATVIHLPFPSPRSDLCFSNP